MGTGAIQGVGVVGLALAATALLVGAMAGSPVWIALVVVGLIVFAGSFLARDLKVYWLSIFLVTLPLSINKMFFFEPSDLTALRQTYGLFINAIEVPLLYLSDLALMVLLALWAGEVVSQRRRLRIPKGALFACAFLGWCVVSLLVARARLLGVSWILYQVKFLLLFLWVTNASLSRRTLRWVVALLVLNMAGQAGVTMFTYARQSGPNIYGDLFGVQEFRRESRLYPRHGGEGYVYEEGELRRGSGTVGVGNETAKFLVPLLPLSLAAALFASRPATRLLASTALLMGMAAMYLTYSRGGLLSALLALVVFFFLAVGRGLVPRRTGVTAVAVALAGIAVAMPLLYGFFTSRPGYFMLRLEHLAQGTRLLANQRLLGVGINNFNVAVSRFDYQGVFSDMAIHNHYLRIGVETGVLGLALYVSFFVWVGVQAYRGTFHPDPFMASISMALLAGVVGTMFYWLDDLFYSVVIRTQFWLLLGLAVDLGARVGRLGPLPGPRAAGMEPALGHV